MSYLYTAALAVGLLVVLRAINHLFLKVVIKTNYRQLFLRWFPILEIVVWTGLGFGSLSQLFGDKSYYPFVAGSLAILLITLVGWYFLRDFIAGFILRSENTLEPGKPFRVGETEGVIVKTGYRSLELVTSSGEQVKIPYSILAVTQLHLPAEIPKLALRTIRIEVTTHHQPETVTQMVLQRVMEMPWVLTSSQPLVTIAFLEEGMYQIDIQLRVQNEESLLKTHSLLLEWVRKSF